MKARITQYLIALIFSASVVTLLGGAKSGCAGGAPEPGPSMCTAASDCEGLPHIECVGQWDCSNGQCQYDCSDEPPPPPQSCWSDDDCGAGYECQLEEFCTMPAGGGADYPAKEAPDGDQAADPISIPVCEGQCVKKTEPECSCNDDCGFNETCIDGTCQTPQTECTYDGDCGPNQYCADYSCPDMPPCDCGAEDDCACPGFAPVPCYGTCKDKETKPNECSYDSECGAGQFCEIEWCEDSTCSCEAPEPGDGDADAACVCLAVEPQCYGTCQDEKIQPPPPEGCATDSDCGDNEYCEGPVCLMWCADDDPDCCGGGVCTELPEPDECQASGCSGEICAAGPVDSICIWEEWYECLQFATCEANESGCGWATQNPEFDECMSKYIIID